MTASCRCWLCNGPARMKYVAYVVREPLTLAQQAIRSAFWARFAA